MAENKGDVVPRARHDENSMGVAGLSPAPGTKLKLYMWNWPAGLPECPYIMRWVLFPFWYSLRLHWWTASDDARAYHNHAWWFFTIVLWGSYVDFSDDGADLLRVGSIRFRRAAHAHTVQILRPTLTLLITGRPLWRWGFRVNGKLIKRDKYFALYGHHPCGDGQTPVRISPKGVRIQSRESRSSAIS
jgi:hypothetical protein